MNETVLAHAFGQRYELPIPLLLFVVGGAAVVAVSFLVVLLRPPAAGAVDGPDELPARPRPGLLGGASVLAAVLVALVGITGTQLTSANLAPTVFWVVVWIGVPLSCGLLGDWTGRVNPFGVVARAADDARLRKAVLARKAPLVWSSRLGQWPAVALFAALVLGELVFNGTTTKPAFVGTAVLLYLVLSAFLGLLFGASWLQRGEVFTGLFDAWGRLGWWRFGAPGRRGVAGGLDTPFAAVPSRVVFVLLLLISINFDGVLATPQWNRYELRLVAGGTSVELLRVATLVVITGAVLVLFGLFASAAARVGGFSAGPARDLAVFLPSLVPIAFGYLVAHYLQYVLTNGQLLFPEIGNPGYEDWPISLPAPFNADYQVKTDLLPNSAYWYVSVVVIVVVHVLAVVLASRAVRARAAEGTPTTRAELVWTVAMVGYTALSLFLIAQPLTEAATGGVG